MIPIDVLVIHTTSKWHSNSEWVSERARHNNTKYNHDTETNTPRNWFSPLEWDWNKVDGRSDYSYCEEEKDKKKSGIAALMHIYQTFVISVELVLNRSWLSMIMWVIFLFSVMSAVNGDVVLSLLSLCLAGIFCSLVCSLPKDAFWSFVVSCNHLYRCEKSSVEAISSWNSGLKAIFSETDNETEWLNSIQWGNYVIWWQIWNGEMYLQQSRFKWHQNKPNLCIKCSLCWVMWARYMCVGCVSVEKWQP